MEEVAIWKLCPATNDKYEVSNKGEVRRIVGEVRNNVDGGMRKVGGNTLRPKTKSNGYLEVNLYIETQQSKMMYVHRLVIMAFVGEIPLGYEVNHKDGNKANNHLSNLEMVTPSENRIHSTHVLGNKPPVFRGENHGNSKLTQKDVDEIRLLRGTGMFYKDIAAKFNVSITNIGHICRNENWILKEA